MENAQTENRYARYLPLGVAGAATLALVSQPANAQAVANENLDQISTDLGAIAGVITLAVSLVFTPFVIRTSFKLVNRVMRGG